MAADGWSVGVLTREVKGLEDAFAVLEERLGAPAADRQDGLRLDWPEERRWAHLRPSGTEPIVRIIAEAPNREQATELLELSARMAAAAETPEDSDRLRALRRAQLDAAAQVLPADTFDPTTASLTDLADHIEQTHHAYLKADEAGAFVLLQDVWPSDPPPGVAAQRRELVTELRRRDVDETLAWRLIARPVAAPGRSTAPGRAARG